MYKSACQEDHKAPQIYQCRHPDRARTFVGFYPEWCVYLETISHRLGSSSRIWPWVFVLNIPSHYGPLCEQGQRHQQKRKQWFCRSWRRMVLRELVRVLWVYRRAHLAKAWACVVDTPSEEARCSDQVLRSLQEIRSKRFHQVDGLNLCWLCLGDKYLDRKPL